MKKIGGIFLSLALLATAGSAFAQAVPEDGWYLRSASWCGPCQGIASNLGVAYESLPSALGSVKYVNADQSQPIAGLGGNVPVLYQVQGGKLVAGTSIFGSGDDMMQKLKELGAGEQKIELDECIFLVPGLVHNNFTPSGEGNIKIAGGAVGYGPREPEVTSPIPGESFLNQELRRAGVGPIEVYYNVSLESSKKSIQNTPDKKVTIHIPDKDQALDYSKRKQYKVNGVDVTPGAGYFVGKQNPLNGITVDENCNPTKSEVADPTNLFGGGANTPVNSPSTPGSGNNPLGANPLLPLLLSGLLSQGLGGGQQNQGQSYGNDALSLPLNCAQQQVSPVCGVDGKTYNNSCYLNQMGVALKNQGVCANPSPSPTPNTSAILSQLSASGVPSALLDAVRNVVASVLSSILSGALSVPETVISQ